MSFWSRRKQTGQTGELSAYEFGRSGQEMSEIHISATLTAHENELAQELEKAAINRQNLSREIMSMAEQLAAEDPTKRRWFGFARAKAD